MSESDTKDKSAEIEELVARLERRLAKVEMVLGMGEYPEARRQESARPVIADGEFELAIGQNLFAKIGILVLAIGGALTLSLPWQGFPALLPSGIGWFVAGVLFLVAQWLQQSMPLNARYFRGSAMALMFFATLRLCYFGAPPLLPPVSMAAGTMLGLAVAINLTIGLWRGSVFLTGLAMVTGYGAALAVGTPWYVFAMVTMLLLLAGFAARKHEWPWLQVFVIPCMFLTYLLWAIGNPLVGNRLEVAAEPFAGVWFLLAWMTANALFMAFLRNRQADDTVAQVGSLLNCGGYVLFLLHTLIRFGNVFTAANVVASVVLLALAVMFWMRERSQFATFVYAMTGYGALTMALIKANGIPELFVWLSAQSLLVVVTAIWFRSRFIIVANFLIYLAVITGYMVLVERESGISLVFVLVALTSSRILKWQKDRLELKTELMRNCYLTSAFVIFPYALYHIVPGAWVALSWVGIALFYYLMNVLTKARKYRWMGHNTLLLTVVYILIMGLGKMEGAQRIISFLVLGTVLLIVSLVFTVLRTRRHGSDVRANEADSAKPPVR